jgi:hypothetical protein
MQVYEIPWVKKALAELDAYRKGDPAGQIILNMRRMNAVFYTASYEGEATGETTCAVVAVDDSIYAERLLAFMAELEQEEPTETTLVPESSVLNRKERSDARE